MHSEYRGWTITKDRGLGSLLWPVWEGHKPHAKKQTGATYKQLIKRIDSEEEHVQPLTGGRITRERHESYDWRGRRKHKREEE